MTEPYDSKSRFFRKAATILVLGVQVAGCSGGSEPETPTKKASDLPPTSRPPGGPGPDGKPLNRGSGR
jgi:hypothetical protein